SKEHTVPTVWRSWRSRSRRHAAAERAEQPNECSAPSEPCCFRQTWRRRCCLVPGCIKGEEYLEELGSLPCMRDRSLLQEVRPLPAQRQQSQLTIDPSKGQRCSGPTVGRRWQQLGRGTPGHRQQLSRIARP